MQASWLRVQTGVSAQLDQKLACSAHLQGRHGTDEQRDCRREHLLKTLSNNNLAAMNKKAQTIPCRKAQTDHVKQLMRGDTHLGALRKNIRSFNAIRIVTGVHWHNK